MTKNTLKTLRNKYFLIVLTLATVLTSCKKNSETELANIDKDLIKEIVNLSTDKMRRLAFTGLNSDEKFYLVQQQLDYVLENIPLNESQKVLITEIKGNMPSNVYNDDQERSTFKQRWRKEWLDKSVVLLGKDFIRTYFTQVVNTNQQDNSSQNFEVESAASNDCGCSSTDDWCSGSTTSCTSGNCSTSSWGCGTFFMDDCNGKCIGRILVQ